ncbi:MAG: leader peptidase (prepilin peptidase) / N-methyltransferase [Solirubrobacteraceae bacterium]|nr:leader peptidase (prepilin peptidase) / N-methyltransferase [Solirubrobacteraceae bacterium]
MLPGLVAAALGGLIIGSLADTLALRWASAKPLRARFRCPRCEHPLGRRELVPVVSWLRLHGRCSACEQPIARRYPLVEATTGAIFVAVALARHDDGAQLLLGLVLVAVLVPLALIDLDTRLLPNRILLPAAVAAVVLGVLLDRSGEVERLLAGLLAGGFFLLTAIAYPRGMGLGDVKLAAVLGLFLGRDVAAALAFALVAGVLAGVVVMRRKGIAEGRKEAVPFGPFLALGAVFALLFGAGLVDAYVGTF